MRKYNNVPPVELKDNIGIMLAKDEKDPPGITVKAKVKVPDKFPEGRWHFAQMIVPDYHFLVGAKKKKLSLNGNTKVLDSRYPYAPEAEGNWDTGDQERETEDSPSWPLDNKEFNDATKLTGITEATVSASFKMYIMFQPKGANSQIVPLAYVPWSWKGKAVLGANGWSLAEGSADAKANAAVETSDHPIWEVNIVQLEIVDE